MSARTLFVLPLAAASLAACSASRPIAPPAPPPAPPAPRVDVAATETLDLGPYVVERPAETRPVEHEVPADLMNNAVREAPRPTAETPSSRPTTTPPSRPGRTVFRTVNGYRVQAMQSTNRVEAERAAQTAMAWWRRTRGGSPEVYLVYRAPYYRVRVGNYAERGEADRVARSLNASFPNAFAVPDRVTVRQQAED
ncbi:MAG: SPOR domain-containing protein [Bacteroidetes bacterium]|nr:SPOR domain-containing protein [Bacteroidota bacterium]